MRHGNAARRYLSLLVLTPLLLWAAAASAADLHLAPRLEAKEDLSRVVPRTDGNTAVMRGGAIDRISTSGRATRVATAEANQTLILGDDGATIGVVTHRDGAADFAPTATFELIAADGQPIWTIGETEDVTYVISKTGTVVGMSLNINVAERNRLHFYGSSGEQVAEISVPYLEGGRFDPAGEIFLSMSSTEGLAAFDAHGAEIWYTPDVRLFAATAGAKEVAVLGQSGLRLLREGQVVATHDLGGLLVRRLAIAPDASRVAIAAKHEIRVYRGTDLLQLWDAWLETEHLAYTSIDIASAGGWVLAGVARDLGRGAPAEERHPDGEIRAYDAAGHVQHRAAMTFPAWNIFTPTVRLDATGKAATVSTRRAVYHTVLP